MMDTMHFDPVHQDYPLYNSRWEHDACGAGFLVQVSGEASHFIVRAALEALARLTHRGAQAADSQTNDGAGIMTQIPRDLLCEELEQKHIPLARPEDLAVGMIFLPVQKSASGAYAESRRIIEQTLKEAGLVFLGWRNPPIDYAVPCEHARECVPDVAQVLLARPAGMEMDNYARTLYYARRVIERRLRDAHIADCYIVSLSHTTLIYKGLLAPKELARFYLDLADPRYRSALAIFHQRYSTNTFPAWHLAQPMRLLAHNGEINTVQGNQHWMQDREKSLSSPYWDGKLEDLLPIVQPDGSDSAQLDNALELLTYANRDLLHSMQMLIPPAWEKNPELDRAQRAWCEYHAGLIEPWDGPAALVFSDGHVVGAALDRHGLRPARYTLTAQGFLVVASETGVLDCEPGEVVEHGRLGPGEMIAVDVERGRVLRNDVIKDMLAQRQPYMQWLDEHLTHLADLLPASTTPAEEVLEAGVLFARQQLFGYTHEDIEMVLRPMLLEKKEPIWSMGDDTPLAVLSARQRAFSDYFRQRFAQVTNPPIDPIRERLVMSLDCYLGPRESLLTETPLHAHLLHLESPLLTKAQLATLRQLDDPRFHALTLSTTFDVTAGPDALEEALAHLEQDAINAVSAGATLLILSDNDATASQERLWAPMPMLIAVGAVHHTLVRAGLRTRTSIICETGTVCDVHQIAVVLGYGAEAIVPTLALASVRALAGGRNLEDLTPEQAVATYLHACEDGLCKIMARMGISTVRNIIGAGQFEVLGLDQAFVERCFTGSALYPGSVTLRDVAVQIVKYHYLETLQQESERSGSKERRRTLADPGHVRFRRDAEYHAYNPLIVRALQKAAHSGSMEDYRQFTALVYNRPPTALHDLFSFAPGTPIPLEQVEAMESIRERFVIAAMSIGALSPETHRTIAAAMNSIGGRSNTGEGGEDPDWYEETLDGYAVSSKTKQVASARFGVTTEYLVRAEELEIKMAQGSKPGEGGQLPPNKVTPFIARLRHTIPGIPLISPPPHHDIYSIEDIAQLIYDLHQVNPQARVGVKLVASRGVGTIAAGVAKAHADYVLISGHDGGTGAAPLQSIKHAGMPWEIGLAETQQVLVKNGLRQRVKVRVDGGFKTGRDVIIGAMLGAEEFAFGTAALVALGCDMARKCHINICSAGIATQREDMRAKFSGKPQFLVNYLTLIAQEVRELMAQLGVKHLDDLIGRTDRLRCEGDRNIDIATLLVSLPEKSSPEAHTESPRSPVAEALLAEAEPVLAGEHSLVTHHVIHNADRSVGASLAGAIARRYGNAGLPGVSITCVFQGAAGQSFGAFSVPGMNLVLKGEANDYVGKCMSGGQIIIAPPSEATFASQNNTILGNTVLYGATGGYLFAAGRAGERFAVRNSGAVAVVEGIGDHGCEYMTGGMVIVLGETGQNFAAGMSSGVAYVLDTDGHFSSRCNREQVELYRISDDSEMQALRLVVEWHAQRTGSKHAERILEEWELLRGEFWCVLPRDTNMTARDFVGLCEAADSYVQA